MLTANNGPCLNCERPDCPGICDKIRNGMSEIDTSKPVHQITWHGVTRTVGEWADILGISRQTLYRQLGAGIDHEMLIHNLVAKKNLGRNLPNGVLEEAYIRISTMHDDYDLYWNRLYYYDGSGGLVARYGTIQTAPTNAISNPTEARALPEVNMSDQAIYRRGWVACVLYIIDMYNAKRNDDKLPTYKTKAKVLKWRAIDGYSIQKIYHLLEEENYSRGRTLTPKTVTRILEPIVMDVAWEAVRRGISRNTQK